MNRAGSSAKHGLFILSTRIQLAFAKLIKISCQTPKVAAAQTRNVCQDRESAFSTIFTLRFPEILWLCGVMPNQAWMKNWILPCWSGVNPNLSQAFCSNLAFIHVYCVALEQSPYFEIRNWTATKIRGISPYTEFVSGQFWDKTPSFLYRTLTRRCAPPSPRGRGELEYA